jgi:hypothetical protein
MIVSICNLYAIQCCFGLQFLEPCETSPQPQCTFINDLTMVSSLESSVDMMFGYEGYSTLSLGHL